MIAGFAPGASVPVPSFQALWPGASLPVGGDLSGRYVRVKILAGFAPGVLVPGVTFGASLPDGGDRSRRCVQVHWFRMVDIVPSVANLQRFRMVEIVPGVVAWCIASSWWRSFRALRSGEDNGRIRSRCTGSGRYVRCIAS